MQPDSGSNYWRGDEEKDLVSDPTAQPAPSLSAPLSGQDANDESDNQGSLLEPVSWDASEYIHHERDSMWFMSFIAITLILIALSVFLIKNYFFTILIVVMAIALFLYARRPPRVAHYTLSSDGLKIDQKFYPFSDFRAFGVVEDGALFSVRLLPTARFSQGLTVYFAENDGERIVDLLGAYLPMEDLKLDLVDVILRRLRL